MFRRMTAYVAFAALCVGAGQVSAQTGGGPSLVASFDCNSAIRPDQTAICSSPQLAAMDIQASTLFTVVQKFVDASELTDLQATERAFLNHRAGCGDDFQCIGEAYAVRINELGQLVNDAARALDKVREEREAGQAQ